MPAPIFLAPDRRGLTERDICLADAVELFADAPVIGKTGQIGAGPVPGEIDALGPFRKKTGLDRIADVFIQHIAQCPAPPGIIGLAEIIAQQARRLCVIDARRELLALVQHQKLRRKQQIPAGLMLGIDAAGERIDPFAIEADDDLRRGRIGVALFPRSLALYSVLCRLLSNNRRDCDRLAVPHSIMHAVIMRMRREIYYLDFIHIENKVPRKRKEAPSGTPIRLKNLWRSLLCRSAALSAARLIPVEIVGTESFLTRGPDLQARHAP